MRNNDYDPEFFVAAEKVNDLVEYVVADLDNFACENHYDKDWVLDMFREKCNKYRRREKK